MKRNRIGLYLGQGFVAAVAIVLFVFALALHHSEREAPAAVPKAPVRKETPPGGTPDVSRPSEWWEKTPVAKVGEEPGRRSPGMERARARRKETPYRPDRYPLTRQVRGTDGGDVVWELDPEELAWLMAHQSQVLADDLSTFPVSTGGLRIETLRAQSFGALRGWIPGDVLLDINGQSMEGPKEVARLSEDPAFLAARGWRVILERQGKTLTFDYRSAAILPTAGREH